MWNKTWTVIKYCVLFVPLVILFFFIGRRSVSDGGGIPADTTGADTIRDGITDSQTGTAESISNNEQSIEHIENSIEHTNNALQAIQRAREILDGARRRTQENDTKTEPSN